MKRKNMISMVTSLALVGVVAIGGTLALLTSQTKSLENTFTVGDGYENMDFFLREHDVTQVTAGTDNYGGFTNKGEQYWKTDKSGAYTGIAYTNIVANTTIDKDPQFGLTTGAPDSWIVAYLDLGANFNQMFEINAIADSYNADVTGQWYRYEPEAEDKYVLVDGKDDIVTGKYYIFDTVVKANGATDPLFTQLKVKTVTDAEGVVLTPSNIVVKGVAVQASVDSTFASARDAVMEAALSIREFQ